MSAILFITKSFYFDYIKRKYLLKNLKILEKFSTQGIKNNL